MKTTIKNDVDDFFVWMRKRNVLESVLKTKLSGLLLKHYDKGTKDEIVRLYEERYKRKF